MKNVALYISAVIFLLVAIVHLVRYAYGWTVSISAYTLPVNGSLVAGVVLLGLVAFLVVAARSR